MRINSLTYNNYNKFNYSNGKIPAFKGESSKQVSPKATNRAYQILQNYRTFWGSRTIKERLTKEAEFTRFLMQKGNVSKDDFSNLATEKQKELAQMAANHVQCSYQQFKNSVNPKTVAKTAIVLKDYFDRQYGENNYRIISLGTSPAAIAQAMEYLNSEVIYLPISGLHEQQNCFKNLDTKFLFDNYKNLGILMEYLASKGVGSEDDNKINIIVDYCISGATIEVAEKCIKHYFGLESDKVRKFDITEGITRANEEYAKRKVHLSENEEYELEDAMGMQTMEKIANVPHFNITDFENITTPGSIKPIGRKPAVIFKKFEDFSKPLSRAYSICLLEELSKLTSGFLK